MERTLKNIFIGLVERLFISKQGHKDILYQIGSYQIWLPPSHKLPEYQKRYKNYDKKLKNILQSNDSSEFDDYIIDIGANVGDTAALIRSFTSSRIVCIEGDDFYLTYLKKNALIIPNLIIVESYVKGLDEIEYAKVIRSKGTGQIILTETKILNESIKLKTLEEILNTNFLKPCNIKLIKSDTDGFDFKILLGNKKLIELYKPSLFFEYAIYFNLNDYDDSIKLICFLESIGYVFIIYDNFGNLLDFVTTNCVSKFKRLNDYLRSCKAYGGGIFYFDVFATTDLLRANQIISSDSFIQ